MSPTLFAVPQERPESMSHEPGHLIRFTEQSLIHEGVVLAFYGLAMLAHERCVVHNLLTYRQVVGRGADSHMEFVESKAFVIHGYRS
jgi:hypothetical protein